VVQGLLPPQLALSYQKISRYSLLVLVLLLLVLPAISPSLNVVGRFVSPLVEGIARALLGIFGIGV
jgi:hypothetical protein